MTPEEAAAVGRFRPEPTLRRRLGAPIFIGLCRVLIEGLNHLDMEGREHFDAARATGRPLLTLSNHVSLFDDPWLVASFMGHNWKQARWCATDALNFFDTPLKARFFGFGKGVPIVRGAGLDQPGMDFLRERLRAGDWVHVFPEGGRSREPEHLRTPLKTGFAHLIKATRPLVVLFHHKGMEKVLPIGAKLPHIRQHLSVRFSEVTDSADGLADLSIEEITAWAERELLALEAAHRGR